MGRFQSEFNQDLQKLTPARLKARRSAASKLAAAVGFGLEQLEDRALFTVVGPVANPGGPYTVNEGSSITLNASGSTGSIVKYEWDLKYNGTFQDQINTTNSQLSYTAGAAKTVTIALEVVDSNNVTSAPVTGTVNINDVLPVITVTGGGSVNRGDTVPISWTYVDPGKESISNWVVDWGDGTSTDTLASSASGDSHVYASDGSFTITVTSHQSVLGNDVTSSGTTSATVAAVNPVITLTGNSHVNELASYTLGFSAVDPSGIDTWAIDWGDGSQTDVLPGSASSAAHTYATHGNYTVTATAIDPAGDSSQATKAVVADDVAPAPTVSGTSGPINEGDTISLTATPNDPGSATTAYAWSVTRGGDPFTLPNGTVTNASTLSFVAGYKGSYVATVVVTDDANETGTVSTSAIISHAVAPTVAITGGYSTSINKGDTVSLSATPSDPGTGDTYTYTWSVTLGGSTYTLPNNVSTTGSSLSFVAGRVGNFVATVTVTDRDGGTGSATTSTIAAADVNPTVAITGAPGTNIGEGTAVALTATPTDTGTNESFTYAWTVTKGGNPFTLPGGVVTNASTLTFTPEDQGNYVATCTVTDSDGDVGTGSSTTITAVDVAPTGYIGGVPDSLAEGGTYNLQAFPSENSTNRIYSYAWSVTQNGNSFTLPNGTVTNAADFSFSPPTEGAYIATVVVTDDEGGNTSFNTGSMTVTNVPPTASIAGTPGSAIGEGTAVSLTATGAEDGSGHTFGYAWAATKDGNPFTLPNGVATNTANLAWTPNVEGAYVASVTVTDEDGHTGTQTSSFTVDNVAPTVTVAVAPGASEPEGTALTFSSTETEPGLGGYTYAWTVTKDGEAFTLPDGVATNTSSLNFTPVAAGQYVASLQVTDGEGGSTTTPSSTVTITPVAPTASITGIPVSSVNELSPLTLGVTSSDVNPSNTRTYSWSVTKNGSAYSLPEAINNFGTSFTFTPNDAGAYVISCAVTNSEGQTTTVDSGSVTVAAIPPTASITLTDGTRAEGNAISASAVIGSVGATDTVTYAWSVQKDGNPYSLNGVTTTGSTFSFTPSDEGSYQIFLTATDSGGSTPTSTSAIAVADVAPAVTITGAPSSIALSPEGTAINLGTTVTQTGANDSVATYAWTITKNGQAFTPNGVTLNASTLSFTPGNAGTYVATVTVTNASDGNIAGGQTQVSTLAINVVNVPPTVVVTGTTGPVTNGTTLNFSAAATEPGSNTLSYAWTVTRNGHAITVANGIDTTSATLTFAAGRAGSFIATCTVTDSEGGVGSDASSSVTVTDVAPTVTIAGEPGTSIAAGTTVALTSTDTDPGALEHFNYAWSVTRNGSNYALLNSVATNTANLNFIPDRVGSYIATLTVTDTDGGATTVGSTAMTVNDVAPTVTVTGPQSAMNEGQTLSFSGSATNPTIGDTFTYSWAVTRNGSSFTLPNGTNAAGTSLSFVVPSGGTYVATASVTDSAGSVGTGSGTETVNYVAPTVTVSGAPSQSISAGSAVSLAATPAEAGSGHTFTYAWSITRNGSAYTLPNGVATNGASLNFNPGRAGSFVATVVVTDEAAGTGTASTNTIHVGDVAPAVGISGIPLASIPEGDPIALTATPTSPGSDETFSYQWSVTKGGVAYSLGNGIARNTNALNFTPGVAGPYLASVTVTDLDNGVTTVTTTPMVVSATALTVNVTGASGSTINSGTAVNLTAAASNSGPGEQFSYQWSVTLNGQPYTLANSVATNTSSLGFTTTDGGLYVATCVATDTSGTQGSANSGNIIVDAVAPTVGITGAPGTAINEGTPVSLTANPADANTADTYSYAWSVTKNGNAFALPQGTVTNAAAFTFTPNDLGTFVASVTVTDKANLSGSTSVTITSNDVAPTVSISGAPQAPVGVGTPLSFSSSVTNVGTSDSVSTYAWSVTKNGNAYTPAGNPAANGSSFSFTPDGKGDYVVTLTATNNHGSVGTASTSDLTIRPVAPNVNVTGTSGTVNEGDAVSLTANATDPSTGDTYTYAWNVTRNGVAYTLANGVATNLATLNFNADRTGTYVATVTVTDADNLQTIAISSSIVSADVPPTVIITGAPQTSIPENSQVVTLTATPTEPGSGQTYTYAWTVTKNGVAFTLPHGTATSTSTLTFTPGRAGSYVATCNVVDADGGTGSSSATIDSSAVNPTVVIAGEPQASIGEGTAVSLTTTTTDPGYKESYTYAWTITLNGQAYTPANGTVLNTSGLNFTPGQPGAYIATCTVTDSDGAVTDESSTSITVTAVSPTVTIAGAPTTVGEGTAINLTATASSPRTNDTFSYAWTITLGGQNYVPANGTVLNNSTLSFTPGLPGAYIATCTVTDIDNAQGSQSTSSIAVTTVPPTVTLSTAPSSISEGTALALTASASSPRTNDTFSYVWTITVNNQTYTPANGTVLNTSALNFTPGRPGTYVATCTVTDADGAIGSQSTSSITVTKVSPVVSITSAPDTVPEGTAVSLIASAISPRTGDTFSYSWNITLNGQDYNPADGTVLNTATLNFTPGQPGAYIATCTVTDTDGAVGTLSSSSIAVTPVAPTVGIAGAPTTASEGTPFSLTATATSPRTSDTFSYAWAITLNGNTYTPADGTLLNGATLNFTPGQPGAYIATCTVTDIDGEVGTQSTASIAVTTVNPVVTLTTAPSSISEGTPVSLTASASSPRTDDTFSYVWTITLNNQPFTTDNGTDLSDATLNFTPGQPGSFVATCTVTDIDGAIGSQSSTAIAVTAVNPLVTISAAPVSVTEGTAVNLNASVSTPRENDTFTYAWTITQNGQAYTPADGTVLNTAALSFTPDEPGTFVATCTVTDADGAIGSQSSSLIAVTKVPPVVTLSTAPTSVSEGTSVSLTASATSPRTDDTFTYAWTLTRNGFAYTPDSGTVLNTDALNFTPGRPGSYVATCTVTDIDGAVGSASSSSFQVTTVNPLVTISTAQSSVAEGTTVNVTASATSPRTDDTFNYYWSVDRNGQAYAPAVGTVGVDGITSFHFTPGLPGNYVITCEVVDADGAVGSEESTPITVTAVAPTVTLTGAPSHSIGEGTAINLATTAGSPRTNDTYSYAWTVTQNGEPFTLDNSVATNAATLNFTPITDGSYVATVAVTDVDSQTTTVSTSAITVVNVPPTVAIQNLPGVNLSTGETFSLVAHATEPGAGNYTYAWTIVKDNNIVPVSTSATWNGTAAISGTYTVHLTVTDGEGGVGNASGVFTVDDVPSVISITNAPTNRPEGTAITLGSTATNPGTQYGETFSYSWTVTRNGVNYPVTNATSPDFTFTPNEYGSYLATLTVTDSQGTPTGTQAAINVTDVAPTTNVLAVPTVLRSTPVTFTGSYADAGVADPETVVWNYGDGTSQTFASTAANAFTPTHTYTTAGQYTATMTVTDGGHLSGSTSQTVTVVAAQVAADPFSAGKTALFVNGSTGNDSIKFYSESGGRVKVTDNGVSLGVFAPTGHIIAQAGSGNDTISLAATIQNPAVLYGNAGSDALYGGGGNNILVAGTGTNSLFGGGGADILVGGNGKDVLTAGTGNDLLVGGNWPFATNQSTLAAIDAQWTRTDESFATIVHQLRGVTAGSLAGSNLVSTGNVTNNNGEILVGGPGRDWFLPVNGDVVQGYVSPRDVESGEAVSKPHVPKKK